MNDLKLYALTFVGLPYQWGGDDPILGYDCSGLCIELLQSVGVLPYGFDTTAGGLYRRFYDPDNIIVKPRFGDLIIFGKTLDKIIHVTFAFDSHRFLEAGGGGSKTTSREKAAKQNAYIRIRTGEWRKDRIAIVRPNYPEWLTL